MIRRQAVAVVSVVVLLVSSCGFLDESEPAASTPASPSSTSSAPSSKQVSAVVDGVQVKATAAPADSDLELTINVGDVAVPETEALVVATAPVSVELTAGRLSLLRQCNWSSIYRTAPTSLPH